MALVYFLTPHPVSLKPDGRDGMAKMITLHSIIVEKYQRHLKVLEKTNYRCGLDLL